MTVSRHRRRVSTSGAALLSLGGLGLAAGLGVAGGVAIYHTTDGQVQGSDVPEDRFPATPTGLLAVVDDAGRLGSVAVFAVRPDGDGGAYDPAGGSIVPVPASADASGGFGDERLPLDESVAIDGSGVLDLDVTSLLGVSIDAVSVITPGELAAALDPLGTVEVDLPGGAAQLDGEELAAALAARDAVSASEAYPTHVAVWRAVAAAIGEGLDEPLTVPGAASGSFRWLTAGTVGVTRLRAEAITDVRVNRRGADAVALDRAEVVTLFAHLAPSRMAAPNLGPNFLLRSRFASAQLPTGMTRYDVAYDATSRLLASEHNVVFVDTTAGDADEVTLVEVADAALAGEAHALEALFGPVEVRVAERRVVGIDVAVTLGTEFFDAPPATGAPETSGG